VNRSFVFVALLLSLLVAASAAAAESNPEKLIEEGLHLRRAGKPAEALDLFRQAHAIAPSPRTFGQMGLVEASLRQWVEGENHLSVSLANLDDPWVAKNRAFLDEALSLCRRHVGDLVVSGAAGIEVSVAGKAVGTLPAVPALRLAEGTVTVTANAPDFQPFERTVTIQPGVRTPLAISLAPIAAAPAPKAAPPAVPAAPAPTPTAPAVVATPVTPPEPPKASSWHTWVGLGLSAVGAAAIGWGAYWIHIDGECPSGKDCSTGSSATSGPYETRTPGWIFAGVGAATVAGGIAIFFTGSTASSANVALGLTPSSLSLAARF
jgi:hypothetical protein